MGPKVIKQLPAAPAPEPIEQATSEVTPRLGDGAPQSARSKADSEHSAGSELGFTFGTGESTQIQSAELPQIPQDGPGASGSGSGRRSSSRSPRFPARTQGSTMQTIHDNDCPRGLPSVYQSESVDLEAQRPATSPCHSPSTVVRWQPPPLPQAPCGSQISAAEYQRPATAPIPAQLPITRTTSLEGAHVPIPAQSQITRSYSENVTVPVHHDPCNGLVMALPPPPPPPTTAGPQCAAAVGGMPSAMAGAPGMQLGASAYGSYFVQPAVDTIPAPDPAKRMSSGSLSGRGRMIARTAAACGVVAIFAGLAVCIVVFAGDLRS